MNKSGARPGADTEDNTQTSTFQLAALPHPRRSPTGEGFVAYLTQGERTHKLSINDAMALGNPGVFERSSEEFPAGRGNG